VWSPDETKFAYGLAKLGKKYALQIKEASGSGPAKLVEETDDINSPTDWSSDGRYLLCDQFLNGRGLLWLLPLNGEQPREALEPSNTATGMQSSGQFSPNGKWLAFTTGIPQVFVVPFPNGSGTWQASGEHGRWPRWRRDGRELFYVSDKNEMMAVEVHAKGEGLELGSPTPLFNFRPSLRILRQGMISYDVSPDGKKFLLNTAADENTRPLTLVVNWPAELKKK
jgi:Tol biopolymer transport system component